MLEQESRGVCVCTQQSQGVDRKSQHTGSDLLDKSAFKGFGVGREPNDELIYTNLSHVQVPLTSNLLDDTGYAELQRFVDPLSPTCGKELYRRTADFVGRKLSGPLRNLN